MIKKLTVAFLLFVTGTLFAQITNVPHTTFLVVDATGNVVGELLIDPLVLPGALTVTGALTAKDSVWIGTFEGSTFRDLNIKQTTTARAIRIEEKTGTEAYEIGIGTDGTFGLYDDDGSLTFYIADGTNQVIVPDSLRVDETSRFTGDAKFESDVLVEGDLDVQGQFTSTLSLDLPYYFSRNVVQLMASTRDADDDYTDWADKDWADAAAGTHGDDATNYLTDAQGITFTGTNAGDGIHIDFTDIDLTQFTDGDTSVTADYIIWSIYITSQDSTDLADVNGAYIAFPCDARTTFTNYYFYFIDDEDLSNGWTYYKVAKSAFTGAGSPNWNAVKGVSLRLRVNADAQVVFTIDNLQMVRDDPDAAEPNPFQSEGPNGTWTADAEEYGNGNIWLVEESGVLSLMCPEGTNSSLKFDSFVNMSVSGVSLTGASGVNRFFYHSDHAQTSATTLILDDSTSAAHSVSMTFAEGDLVYWDYVKNGTSITLTAKNGSTVKSVSTFGHAGARPLYLYVGGTGQRYYSFGFSEVEFAAEAGMAYQVEYLFYRNDTLFVKHAGTVGDSLAAIVPDVILKE